MIINIIGAGLAGCEASNFLANHGFKVRLYEKRPLHKSEAHHTDLFGELVCSNSLKSKKLDNACGLLKEEIRLMGSLMMEASEVSEVNAGDSLAVDREVFAKYITNKIKSNPNIEIIYEDVKDIKEGITLITTGPLTSKELLDEISKLTNQQIYSFFDASAPIVYKNSIDFSKVYYKSRYEQGDDSYINCPMNKEEYEHFIKELLNAKKALLHEFDKQYFEGCLPIEVMASRGIDTLKYGPLKPKGLEINGVTPYAVVQLRQDDLIGDFYNLVGFQTNLTYPEQKRVFSLIPGLENAKFVRYGLMHRNSYVFAPKVLNDDYSLKINDNIYIAGQLSGVEGYVESAASGLLAAYYIYFKLKGIEYNKISFNTVLGALTRYISHTGLNSFAPMNANYGLIYRANSMDKKVVADRSLLEVKKFIKQINE
ncbi:MAG: methylenetetrahydrofolate--tRNA-(uracil(54)-C(5))-methyltransferase (FADH(2)-oxidizing) TrmFO [Mollicutes bacterium]|nr:methylenetetrahydrofolate--tRNA-(uracil(54)-C(5))-methyltransferase (FADH(2)-oxidizing) TrmFO [Mollicutes bacterium]MDD7264558.1 methylenetetrahydrofolate--tRNA-(uracil(54)-C(5))-methyltransferase (FADH(2)-oxidizing) TrmFO [bacterium]MDY4979289.1 methylenetetrahydrofolate--tRNA-(uracil(54)-C(5))-methyltransferase (FADH(2)-oxidizing) TrmFO [Candidatus Onthovivens sp.]